MTNRAFFQTQTFLQFIWQKTKLSKALAYLLRHGKDSDIVLDSDGFAEATDVLETKEFKKTLGMLNNNDDEKNNMAKQGKKTKTKGSSFTGRMNHQDTDFGLRVLRHWVEADNKGRFLIKELHETDFSTTSERTPSFKIRANQGHSEQRQVTITDNRQILPDQDEFSGEFDTVIHVCNAKQSIVPV